MKKWTAILLALLLAGCAQGKTQAAPVTVEVLPEQQARPAQTISVGRLFPLRWYSANELCPGTSGAYEMVYRYRTDEEKGDGKEAEQMNLPYGILLYTDYETRTQRPLCNVEGCTHDSPACPAYVENPPYRMCTYLNDRLYLMHYTGSLVESDGSAFLIEIDPETLQRRELHVFEPGREVQAPLLTDGRYLFGNSYSGIRAMQKGENEFYRVDLKSGETAVIDGHARYPVGVYGEQLVLDTQHDRIPAALRPTAAYMETAAWNAANAEQRLELYDPETGKRTLVTELPVSGDSGEGWWQYQLFGEVYGDYYYSGISTYWETRYTHEFDLCRYHLKTGECELLLQLTDLKEDYAVYRLMLHPAGISDEPYVNIRHFEKETGIARADYILDAGTGEKIHPYIKGFDGDITPAAETPDGYWVFVSGWIDSEPDLRGRSAYSMVKKEDVISGRAGADSILPVEMWKP